MKNLFLVIALVATSAQAAQIEPSSSSSSSNINVIPKKIEINREMRAACENIYGNLSLDGLCRNVVAANNKVTTGDLINCLTASVEGNTFNNITAARCLLQLVK